MYLVKDPEAFDAIPELGMGYHFGVVQKSEVRADGKEGVIVLNSHYAVTANEIMDYRMIERLLRMRGEEALSTQGITVISAPPLAYERSIAPSEDISLFKKSFGELVSNLSFYETRDRLHASPAFPLSTKSADQFVRFSAFRNDRRIQPNGSLLPGTYVTSERDARLVPSGFAAVGRYALPIMLPASNRFDITVPAGTSGLVGTVAPAFGQAGGGVEIEFTNATPSGSVTAHSTIPEY